MNGDTFRIGPEVKLTFDKFLKLKKVRTRLNTNENNLYTLVIFNAHIFDNHCEFSAYTQIQIFIRKLRLYQILKEQKKYVEVQIISRFAEINYNEYIFKG